MSIFEGIIFPEILIFGGISRLYRHRHYIGKEKEG
jgi:hypothetical protein